MKWSTTYATRHARLESKRQRDLLETRVAKFIIGLILFLVALGITFWNS